MRTNSMPRAVLITEKNEWDETRAFTGWEAVKNYYYFDRKAIQKMMNSLASESGIFTAWIVEISSDMPGAIYFSNVNGRYYHVYEFEDGTAEVETFHCLLPC